MREVMFVEPGWQEMSGRWFTGGYDEIGMDVSLSRIAANLTPFKISTSPNFICGSPIDFSFFVKSDQETRVLNFRLNAGAPGLPVRFNNNVPVAIPDGNPNGISSTVTVSNITSAVSKVTVSLHATHQYDGDVVFQLISPDGITNNLSVNHGSFGQNYGSSCSPDSARRNRG